jgi:hypothetical protein
VILVAFIMGNLFQKNIVSGIGKNLKERSKTWVVYIYKQ